MDNYLEESKASLESSFLQLSAIPKEMHSFCNRGASHQQAHNKTYSCWSWINWIFFWCCEWICYMGSYQGRWPIRDMGPSLWIGLMVNTNTLDLDTNRQLKHELQNRCYMLLWGPSAGATLQMGQINNYMCALCGGPHVIEGAAWWGQAQECFLFSWLSTNYAKMNYSGELFLHRSLGWTVMKWFRNMLWKRDGNCGLYYCV